MALRMLGAVALLLVSGCGEGPPCYVTTEEVRIWLECPGECLYCAAVHQCDPEAVDGGGCWYEGALLECRDHKPDLTTVGTCRDEWVERVHAYDAE